jgi:hypothetical protein
MADKKKRRLPPEPRPGFLHFGRAGVEWKRYGRLAQVEKRPHVPRFKWGRKLMGLPPQRQPKSE